MGIHIIRSNRISKLWLNDVFVSTFAAFNKRHKAFNKRHTTFAKLWLNKMHSLIIPEPQAGHYQCWSQGHSIYHDNALYISNYYFNCIEGNNTLRHVGLHWQLHLRFRKRDATLKPRAVINMVMPTLPVVGASLLLGSDLAGEIAIMTPIVNDERVTRTMNLKIQRCFLLVWLLEKWERNSKNRI